MSAEVRARVRLDGPVDPQLTLSRLRLFPGDVTTRRIDGAVCCAMRTADGPAAIAYRRVGDDEVDARAWGPGAEAALAGAFDHLGGRDRPEALPSDHPVVGPLARRLRGLRIGRTGRVVERLIPTIIAQKVTGAGAARSYRQLLAACSERAPGPLPGLWLPPSLERLRELAYHDFHRFGIERRRAETILEVVRRARRLDALGQQPPEVVTRRLTALRGVGPWTAAFVVGAALGDPDAVPVGDYNLPHLVTHALAGEPRGDDPRMLELLAPFRPQRGRVIALLVAGASGAPRRGPRLPVRDIRGR